MEISFVRHYFIKKNSCIDLGNIIILEMFLNRFGEAKLLAGLWQHITQYIVD